MDGILPVGHRKRSENKQYSLQFLGSNNVVWFLRIRHLVLQWQMPWMVLLHPVIITRRLHAKLTRIPGISNINIPYHTTTGTRITNTSLHGKFQWSGIYLQGIIWPSQGIITQQSIMMFGMDPHQKWGFLILQTHQRVRKHHIRLSIEGFLYHRWIPHQYYQTYPTTTEISIIKHQNNLQRYYLLDIVSSSILDMTGIIS